jgi:branched-chain amino acid transport system ATP-binding protein
MQVVMGVCEEIHVLDHGETIAHGSPDEVRAHPKVLAAYLGEDVEETEQRKEGAPFAPVGDHEARRPDGKQA